MEILKIVYVWVGTSFYYNWSLGFLFDFTCKKEECCLSFLQRYMKTKIMFLVTWRAHIFVVVWSGLFRTKSISVRMKWFLQGILMFGIKNNLYFISPEKYTKIWRKKYLLNYPGCGLILLFLILLPGPGLVIEVSEFKL